MTVQVINVGAVPNDHTGDPERTAFQKINTNFSGLSNSFDITSFGAVQNVDCSSIVTTAAATVSEIIFPAGAWVISSTPTIPTGVLIRGLPGATFSGTGASILGLSTASTVINQMSEYAPPGSGELATNNIFRNPTAAGGVGVSAGLRAQTNVGANVTQFEWAILGIVNNSATAGQNVGVYGQGNKGSVGVTAGPTWGGVFEAHDKSGLADPASGLVGCEVHISSDGTDANTRRIGIDVVGDVGVTVGGDISYGIRIGAFNGVDANCVYYNGIYIRNKHTRAINISSTGVVGIDISSATLSGSAIRLAATQTLSFTVGDTKTLRYVGASAGIVFASTGTDEITFLDAGGIKLNMSGTPLVISGTNSTGAATPTLSANKPGSNGGVSFWISATVGGTQVWIPAFAN